MSAPRIPVYYVGQRNPSVSDQITSGGAGVDLTSYTVQFKMRRLGTDTLKVDAAATTKDASGNVTYALAAADIDTEGFYAIWWEATLAGKAQHVLEALLEVRKHGLSSGHLIDLHEARQALELRAQNAEVDDVLVAYIGAASDCIKNEYGRELLPVASATRDVAVRAGELLVDLSPYDLRSVVSATYDPGAGNVALVSGTDYLLSPIGGDDWGVFTELLLSGYLVLESDSMRRFGVGTLRINGAWGFAAVPEFAKQACKVTVKSWMRAGAPAAAGDAEVRASGGFVPQGEPTYALPAAARRLLAPLRRNAGAL